MAIGLEDGVPFTPEEGQENLVSLCVIAKRLRVACLTVHRWSRDGRWNVDRTRIIRLECRKAPRGMATNRRLYEEFIRRLNEPGTVQQAKRGTDPS